MAKDQKKTQKTPQEAADAFAALSGQEASRVWPDGTFMLADNPFRTTYRVVETNGELVVELA